MGYTQRTRTCSINECESRPVGRGLCSRHYYSAKRLGTLPNAWTRATRATTDSDALTEKTERTEGCWLWRGAVSTRGYGVLPSRTYAHRAAWAQENGEIPEGKYVDHVCHNRLCVNPQHLRLTTPKQNIENHSGPTRASTSGARGVYWSKRDKRWYVQVGHNGRRYSGGRHDTLAEAEEAARLLRNTLFTHNDIDRLIPS